MKEDNDYIEPTEEPDIIEGAKESVKAVKEVTGEYCDDCHGGLNAHGQHLDCRTCNNTGIKPS